MDNVSQRAIRHHLISWGVKLPVLKIPELNSTTRVFIYLFLNIMSHEVEQDIERQISLLPSGWVNLDRLVGNTSSPVDSIYSTACTSPGGSLITFAIVNVLTLLSAFILGRASVQYRLSCGLLPKPDIVKGTLPDPKSFLRVNKFIPAIVMICLDLVSSVVGAFLVSSSGVLTLPALIMMALARPRGTWITIIVSFGVANVLKRLGVIKERKMWMRHYQSSHFTMIVTEIVLEIIGIAPTVHLFATIVDPGRDGSVRGPGKYPRIMYIGAIVYVIGISISTTLLVTAITLWMWKHLGTDDEPPIEEIQIQLLRLKTVKRRRRLILWSMFAFGWIPALGSWMIWTGFVHVAKDL